MSRRAKPGRRTASLPLLMSLVAATLALDAVQAPPTSDLSFDMPTLAVAAEPLGSTTTTSVPDTTTTTATPTATAPPAPVLFDPVAPGRENLGGDRHPDVEIPAIGMVEIPKIGLVHPVFEGIHESELHWGPGHWPGSAMPGAPGNAVFAGHRVTHTRPVLDIDRLAVGDHMVFRTADGTFTYEVTEHLIVTPDAVWIAQPTPDPTVTIFACHPKRSAKQRYVVRGRLIGSAP